MTDIGRTCRERAIIEFERRFLQSKLDVRLPLDSPLRFIHINDRQLAATLIDLRTAKCAHLTPSQRTAAQSALSTRYVAFYVQYFAFERAEKAEAATAQRAAEAAVASAASSLAASSSTAPPSSAAASSSAAVAAAATVPVVVAKKAKTADSALASGMAYGGADDMDGFTFDDADSGDDSEEEEVQKTEADFAAEDKVAAEAEFKHVFKTWVTLNVDWRAAFPETKLGQGQLDLVKDLMSLDMGQFYKKVISEDPGRVKYGFMPMLAGCGDGQIGALNAESFAERIISGANLVMNDGNTLLGDKHLEMLVVLRMNRSFMEFMRKHYFAEIKAMQPFNMTVVVEPVAVDGAE